MKMTLLSSSHGINANFIHLIEEKTVISFLKKAKLKFQ